MVQVSYPGVYIQEKASGVRTITGVATSTTAFIGRAKRGPVNDPVRIQSYSEYSRTFGGLSLDSSMSYSVQQFFQNGGSDALIVRVFGKPSAAQQGLVAAADGVAFLILEGSVAAQGTLTLATNPSDGDTMTIGSKVYTFDNPAATAAQGTLTLVTNPSNGDTMTIGGKVYTFETALTNVDGHIAIGATAPGTQANIVAAINLTGGPGYAALMTAPSVTAAIVSGNVVLTAKTAGVAGNSIATTETFTTAGNVFDAATLGTTTPGVDAVLTNADGRIALGANPAATEANIVAAINLSGTPGTQYAASMTQHPTVTAAIVSGNVVLTAKTPGIAGNSIATTETFTAAGNVFDSATLGTTRAGVNSTANGPELAAANPGAWGNNLRVRIDHQTRDPSDTNTFNLEIREINPSLPATSPPVQSERFLNVSVDTASPLFFDKVLENQSKLARVRTTSTHRPAPVLDAALVHGSDGMPIGDNDIASPTLEGVKQGLWALEKADLFNLLCIPPLTRDDDIGALTALRPRIVLSRPKHHVATEREGACLNAGRRGGGLRPVGDPDQRTDGLVLDRSALSGWQLASEPCHWRRRVGRPCHLFLRQADPWTLSSLD